MNLGFAIKIGCSCRPFSSDGTITSLKLVAEVVAEDVAETVANVVAKAVVAETVADAVADFAVVLDLPWGLAFSLMPGLWEETLCVP